MIFKNTTQNIYLQELANKLYNETILPNILTYTPTDSSGLGAIVRQLKHSEYITIYIKDNICSLLDEDDYVEYSLTIIKVDNHYILESNFFDYDIDSQGSELVLVDDASLDKNLLDEINSLYECSEA